MADQRGEILGFIKENGPVLPIQIAKKINTNTLFASAILSELVARKDLKISSAPIGGSPLYYLVGQEDKMDSRLSGSLSGKEKQAYELVKEKKILCERNLEPWQRVAVKDLKDFAVQIKVSEGGVEEVFWKYHLVSDEEAKNTISTVMKDLVEKQKQIESVAAKVEEVSPVVKEEVEAPKPKVVEEKPKIVEKKPEVKKEVVQEKLKVEEKPKEVKKPVRRKVDSQFYSRILEFLKENETEVLKEEIIRKDREFDFVVNISSSFGKLKYLVKCKNKALINEGDVSMAFSDGQLKKMPVILLVNGKISKKAATLVEQRMHGQLVLKKI